MSDPLKAYRSAVWAYRDAFKAGKDTLVERVALDEIYNVMTREEQFKADAFWEWAQKAWP